MPCSVSDILPVLVVLQTTVQMDLELSFWHVQCRQPQASIVDIFRLILSHCGSARLSSACSSISEQAKQNQKQLMSLGRGYLFDQPMADRGVFGKFV